MNPSTICMYDWNWEKNECLPWLMAIISKVATWSSGATLWAVQKKRNELGVLILAHAVHLKKHETNLVKHMSADLRYMQGVCANSVYQRSIVPLIHTKCCKSKASSLGARSQGVRTYSHNQMSPCPSHGTETHDVRSDGVKWHQMKRLHSQLPLPS